MDDTGLPPHFVELKESAPHAPAVTETTVVPVPAPTPAVAVVREELVLRRRRVTPRAPRNELGRGEVRIGVVRERGQAHGTMT